MTIQRVLVAGVAGIAIAVLSSFSARAAVISSTPNQTLTATPFAVSFQGVGSFLFTSATTGYGPGAAVATTGSAQVTTLFGGVTDFEQSASIDQTGELYTFASYATPQAIPYSAADDYIGLQLTLSDGVHYGYAEVSGPELVSYGFQSTAGTSIAAGATAIATPEPATLALLGTGLAMLSVRRRRT